MVYSLPFCVQPLYNAFQSVPLAQVEASTMLGKSRWQTFRYVEFPQARPGFITAAILTFAHTLGEFGVVLMVGGNIAGETRVVSIAIYDYVESLQFGMAHTLSLILLVFSFVTLLFLQRFQSARVSSFIRRQ
jgi:molybdate transport system permease protein